jgi:hypothetical protein
MTPEQIVELLPGLEIEKAEVRRIEDLFPEPGDPRGHIGSAANVTFASSEAKVTPSPTCWEEISSVPASTEVREVGLRWAQVDERPVWQKTCLVGGRGAYQCN